MADLIKTMLSITTEDSEELHRILDHHVDYLIDMDANSDIVTSIGNVISYNVDDKHDKHKLQMLAQIVDDILETEPSDEDLDNDDTAIEMYANIKNLKESLKKYGLL